MRSSAWMGVGLVPAALILLGLLANPHSSLGRGFTLTLLVVVVTVNQGSLRYFGVVLTPTEAVVRNWRSRRIALSDVQAVTLEWYLGSRRLVIWTRQGRVPLRAPVAPLGLLGGHLERSYHTIGQWWLAHRGPEWVPPAQPAPLPWPPPPMPWSAPPPPPPYSP